MYDFGLSYRESCNMSFSRFYQLNEIERREDIKQMQRLRLILAAITGKRAKVIVPLPGDYDNVPLSTREYAEEVARAFGVYEKWNLGKK